MSNTSLLVSDLWDSGWWVIFSLIICVPVLIRLIYVNIRDWRNNSL